jgi:Zn-dependent peptidase ImmA (M78 family)
MSRRATQYETLKALARDKREHYEVVTEAFGLRELRNIYKAEGIRIDYYPLPWKIKALYMCADGECSVAVQRKLPDEPKLFALVHELKHHYCDREALGTGVIHCGDYNMDEVIEIGAEVFAAEFIYPEAEFARDIASLGIRTWTPQDVVGLKRNCKAKVSYRYLCKRLERLGHIGRGAFDGVKFQKLEEQLYGVPYHRRRRAFVFART